MPAPKPKSAKPAPSVKPIPVPVLFAGLFLLTLGVAYFMIQTLLPGVGLVKTAPLIIVFFGFTLGVLAFFVLYLTATAGKSAADINGEDSDHIEAKKLV